MDVVYVLRDGENPELRYSLRSLKNVQYDMVWAFGGAPVWLQNVNHVRRAQKASAYSSTRAHIAAACQIRDVSDPFMLWDDDYFAMRKIGILKPLHRGLLADVLRQYEKGKNPWVMGMREAAAILASEGIKTPVSYDNHLPLIVHKGWMEDALRLVARAKEDAIHLRTIYGNIAKLGGEEAPDGKLLQRSDPFPLGPWLSSGDATYRHAIEPVLRYTFPDKCLYEKGPA